MPTNTVKPTIYLGLMSGTSLDGVDIAAVDFSNGTLQTIAAATFAYDDEITELLKLSIHQANKIDAPTLAQLDNQLGLHYASLLNVFIDKHNISRKSIAAIGSHGHTLLHQPKSDAQVGYSIQIGNPNHIAAQTACTVVADFRRADIALGGQGAPLAPAFHGAYLADESENRIVANLGGIANISLLEKTHVLKGFDTGPSNTLMDTYCQEYYSKAYDPNGKLAAAGTIDDSLCSALLSDPYFAKPAPKSTGREYFNLEWLKPHLAKLTSTLSHDNILASLCYVTAKSIANACLLSQQNTARLLICGGGVHNKTLINMLQKCLPYPVQSTADYDLDPDYVEALAFAWLAKQRLSNIPANLPQVTGASKKCLLGAIYTI